MLSEIDLNSLTEFAILHYLGQHLAHRCCCCVFQSLSCVWFFATPWPAARQSSLSFTISRGLLKLMSIEWGMLPNRLILCRPLLLLPSIFPSIRVFSNESALYQSMDASASASVLPMNIQDLFPSELTNLISLLSKGLSRVFYITTIWKNQFFGI